MFVDIRQEYETALKFIGAILNAEPNNPQAKQLEAFIQKKLRNGMLPVLFTVLRLSLCMET